MSLRVRYAAEGVAVVVLALAALLFIGGRIAPCPGGIGSSQDEVRRACAAAWVAALPPIDRFTNDHPEAIAVGVAALAILVVIAFEFAWRAASRRRPRADGR